MPLRLSHYYYVANPGVGDGIGIQRRRIRGSAACLLTATRATSRMTYICENFALPILTLVVRRLGSLLAPLRERLASALKISKLHRHPVRRADFILKADARARAASKLRGPNKRIPGIRCRYTIAYRTGAASSVSCRPS